MASLSHETQQRSPFVLRIHATENLQPYLSTIEQTSRKAIVKVTAVMPITDFSVDIFDNPAAAIPEYGIGGFAFLDEGRVEVDLDPFSPYREEAIRERLERTIAHELHHLERMQQVGYPLTLRDALVLEGLAEQFEIEITGGEPSLEVTALTPSQIQELLLRAKEELTDEDFVQSGRHEAWYFGSEKDDISRWTVYSLGFYVVGKYLKAHPEQKPSILTAMPSDAFIS